MGVLDVLRRLKIGGGIQKNYNDNPDDDYKTRDNYLRSLRRERRMQLEEVEKANLKRTIEAYRKGKERKYLWGLKGGPQRKTGEMLKTSSCFKR